eukprot:scaffold4766_cov115-Isochrysis_galbana.AAC.11
MPLKGKAQHTSRAMLRGPASDEAGPRNGRHNEPWIQIERVGCARVDATGAQCGAGDRSAHGKEGGVAAQRQQSSVWRLKRIVAWPSDHIARLHLVEHRANGHDFALCAMLRGHPQHTRSAPRIGGASCRPVQTEERRAEVDIKDVAKVLLPAHVVKGHELPAAARRPIAAQGGCEARWAAAMTSSTSATMARKDARVLSICLS